ncbi:Predicted membrane protein (DUF2207) [Propionibacterium ruminifibrarum]|uniref:Predicted membrane protein (DUF2207) n=1 Tax=Propionibacterium ruminifibrarum TaxID=1962131 RepID=A0A375I3Z6_9ACTN|nr:DUF2207 domain-containing protein [Propionibacterium ruminifibrarum]SPF68142.1 Predicted membrane protein (DUF2207) [Propionibacterium ruminifibrarum]
MAHTRNIHGLRAARRGAAGALAAAVALLGVLVPGTARADDNATSLEVSGVVSGDGTLTVTEEFTFADGSMPGELTQRLATTRDGLNATVYRYEISDVTAEADGSPAGVTSTTDGDYQVITVDASQAEGDTLTVSYTVQGAALAGAEVKDAETLTTVQWRMVQGLSVGVGEVSGSFTVDSETPASIADVDCEAGAPAALTRCSTVRGGTFEDPWPVFTNGALGAGQVLELTVKVPSSAVAPNQMLTQRWSLDRAFTARPLQLVVSLGALVLGGALLWGLHRRLGRDHANTSKATSVVARWKPVAAGKVRFSLEDDVRPGEIGTIVDEHVDPVDLTASVLDLAVRGYLRITQLPSESPNKPTDWLLERTSPTSGAAVDELHPYEQKLLDALVGDQTTSVRVSELAPVVGAVVRDIQNDLYDEVVAKGWFSGRPDAARTRWGVAGWTMLALSVVAFVLLVAFTTFGLLGLSLIVVSLGLIYTAQKMPRRTLAGVRVVRGLELLAMELTTKPTDSFPRQDAYEQISSVLPYSVVLGGFGRWLDALAAADDDPGVPDPEDLSWYHAPDDWNLSDLPDSLRNFVTTMQGRLYSRG